MLVIDEIDAVFWRRIDWVKGGGQPDPCEVQRVGSPAQRAHFRSGARLQNYTSFMSPQWIYIVYCVFGQYMESIDSKESTHFKFSRAHAVDSMY